MRRSVVNLCTNWILKIEEVNNNYVFLILNIKAYYGYSKKKQR